MMKMKMAATSATGRPATRKKRMSSMRSCLYLPVSPSGPIRINIKAARPRITAACLLLSIIYTVFLLRSSRPFTISAGVGESDAPRPFIYLVIRLFTGVSTPFSPPNLTMAPLR